MRTQQIRKMIEKAVDDEKRTGRLASMMRDNAKQAGISPKPKQIQGAVEFVRGYIEHVPYYLEQGASNARAVGLGTEMDQMIRELEAYWFEPDDAIPDHLGLIGLMDDAYASLLLLQGMSEYCQSAVGQPLLADNITVANQAIRQMIGAPIASHLEQRVGITIGQTMMQQMLTQVATVGGFPFGGGPDPVWGNASMDEIVTARLGAMGVVF